MSISSAQKALLRTENQYSLPMLGLLNSATVFSCQINDTFTTHDMTVQFDYDNVTYGSYTDVIPGQTCFIGSTAGAYDIGICRIRADLTATTIYIGETSEIDFENDYFVTVIDAFEIWPKHPTIVDEEVFMDYDVDYTDQHTNMDPIPIMGGHLVLDVTSYPVAVDFPDVADCYVYGSSISSRSFTSTGGVVTNGTSTNPTLTISSYPTNGYVRVKLTVNAANGKTFDGYRYVLVYDSDHRPITDFTIEECSAGREEGGWHFTVTLNDTSDIATLRERQLAILFSRDYYDGTQDVVGMQADRENIWVSGWIFQHLDVDDPEFSPNTFDVYSAHFWMQKMAAFTVGVEIATSTAAAWTEIASLTLDKGLWHFFHWRTTATQVMDVLLTGDTKYSPACESPATNLWGQITEMAQNQIFAIPTCDYNNRLFVKVPYNLIPETDRTTDSELVMDLITQDYEKTTEVEKTPPVVSQVVMSGVAVDASGSALPYFSLSKGHTPAYLGEISIIDRLLLSSQSQANSLAGLVFGKENNPYPLVPITFVGSNRAFDIAPIYRGTITLSELGADAVILPVSIDYSYNHETGKLTVQIDFEAETFEAISTNGDIPLGNGEVFTFPKIPPLPSLPSLPPIDPLVVPGTVGDETVGPSTVMITTTNFGIMYTTTFDEDEPVWYFMNSGFDNEQGKAMERMYALPNGAIYGMSNPSGWGGGLKWGDELWYCPYVGGEWELISNVTDLFGSGAIVAIGFNPDVEEEIFAYGGPSSNHKSAIGDHTTLAVVASGGGTRARGGDAAYIANKWFVSCSEDDTFTSQAWSRFSATGSLEVNAANYNLGQTYSNSPTAMCLGGAYCYIWNTDSKYLRKIGNESPPTGTDTTTVNTGVGGLTYFHRNGYACDPTGQYLMGVASPAIAQRSSDFSATWGAVDVTLGIGYTVVENCASANSFIMGTVQSLKYTGDFGDSWVDKSGNLPFIAGLCAIKDIVFVAW